jgi:hypothetical protein
MASASAMTTVYTMATRKSGHYALFVRIDDRILAIGSGSNRRGGTVVLRWSMLDMDTLALVGTKNVKRVVKLCLLYCLPLPRGGNQCNSNISEAQNMMDG